jgi:secretory phospholipase A2
MKLLPTAVFLASFMACAYSQESIPEVLVARYPDGRSQIRAISKGMLAMDTEVTGHLQRLREISDGNILVRLMLSPEDNILDCQVDFEPSVVKSFLNQVATAALDSLDLATIIDSVQKSLPGDVAVDVEKIVEEKYKLMLDLAHHKTQCGLHHSGRKHRGTSPRRSARSIFIFPGTNWCGSGNQGEQLGQSIDTDKCCREHDNCPYYIESMHQKYGHFNMRLYTISHCACDEHFRTCLRLAGTESANHVGNWYFNLIKLDCFIFKPTVTCVERAWYGRCLRYENDFVAEIRDALEY